MRRTFGNFPVGLCCLISALAAFTQSAFAQQVLAWGNNTFGQTNVPPSATNAIAVAGGGRHSVALLSDGSVICWGATSVVDPAATNVVAISAGALHTLALRADGLVVAWGDNSLGQCDVPGGATNIVAISAGHNHNLALSAEGFVIAWGDNISGQTNISLDGASAIAIAAGENQSLVMRSDGLILGFGNGNPVSTLFPNQFAAMATSPANNLFLGVNGIIWAYGGSYFTPTAATNVVAIAVGTNHNIALKSDGRVVAWGSGAVTNVPAGATNIFAISAGFAHGLAVRGNGAPRLMGPIAYHRSALIGEPLPLAAQAVGLNPKAVQWFTNGVPAPGATSDMYSGTTTFSSSGDTFQVTVTNASGAVTSSVVAIEVRPMAIWDKRFLDAYRVKRIPIALTNPIALSLGAGFGVALNAGGAPFAWGNNSDGQADVPMAATNLAAIAAGPDHVVALRRDGQVLAWGRNWDGQCNIPQAATNVVAVAGGWAHSLALRGDGTVIAWGNNDYQQASVSYLAAQSVAIAAGYYHSLALRADGQVVSWGAYEEVPTAATNAIGIAAGWGHSLALRADGTVLAWGNNDFGQCDVPASATNVTRVVAGWFSSFAIRNDGSVLGWGGNQFGLTNIPPSLAGVVQLAVGEDLAITLCSQGAPRLESIAENVATQIGGQAVLGVNALLSGAATFQWYREGSLLSGATNQTLILKPVSGTDAGSYTLVACNGSGCVTSSPVSVTVSSSPQTLSGVGCWGDGSLGQRALPGSILNPRAIAAGAFHNLVINGDGVVIGWGKNNDGQVTVPTALTNVTAVAAGGDHSLALLNSGIVIGWGRDWDGQTNAPASASNIVSIAAGWAHNLALRDDGTIVAWGNNLYGQTKLPAWLPKLRRIAAGYYHNLAIAENGSVVAWGAEHQVPAAASNAVAVAAGFNHSLVLRTDGTIVAWGGNEYGQCDVPAEATNALAAAAGWGFSVARLVDGTVKVWGKSLWEIKGVPAGLENVAVVLCGEDHVLVMSEFGPPRLLAGPTNYLAHTGGNVLMTTEWAGTQPLAFQWSKGGNDLAGANARFLSLTNLQQSHAGTYTISVTNAVGLVVVQNVELLVLNSPRIESQPVYLALAPGESLCLTAAVTGDAPFSFQWLKNGTPLTDGANILGALSNSVCVTPAQMFDGGDYALVVSNPHGAVTGLVARVAISPVVVWGDDSLEQTLVPVAATNVWAIASGDYHSLALTTSGTVLAWGDDSLGQTNVPASATNVVQIAAGASHGVALRMDGSVIAWGDNGRKQIEVPSNAVDVISIAAGGDNTLALRADGALLVWGATSSGQTNIPPGTTNVAGLAAGRAHEVALLADGSVKAWGNNIFGLSATVGALTNVASVAAGGNNTMTLFPDGTVAVWGERSEGQTNVPPVATNVVAINVNGNVCFAVRADGSVVAWGASPHGQTNLPSVVTNVVGVAAGEQHVVALLNQGQRSPAWQGVPSERSGSIGDPVSLFGSGLPGGRTWYQWSFNGRLISGATNAVLLVPNLTWTNVGVYSLVTSNALGQSSVYQTTLIATRSPFRFDTNSLVYNPEAHTFSSWITGATASGDVVVFASSDLTSWTPVFTNPPTLGSVWFSHEVAPEDDVRLFRAVELVNGGGIRLFIDRADPLVMERGAQLRVEGLTTGGSVVIHASSDLVNWSPVHTNPPTAGPLYFFEPEPTNGVTQRFYRAYEAVSSE